MNTCQVKGSEQAITFTLFTSESDAFKKIQENLFDFVDLDLQTVMIRAISSEQWKQIAENPLTERELCILQMIVNGKSNLVIAQELFITVGTVKTHIRHIFLKLNVTDRTQATVLALRSGLVD
ncbi:MULTISPECIES: response regulator transcription factor [Nostoc]|uniref:Response regulator transcription factor n=2 Tax=Nostoc TaxID=1177 RepID=A0ABR8IIR5_9NOSO|nr:MULTISPECIES: response regulator transcription factor [Nostoc]MBD2564954.1 response regulator transcription factor [Nostoc linckia FACHB-391]MBD2651470.1 response regulator transcription factor [Nostoc foliaceum FACHB-393]